ncbi:uncharacterized protein LOC5521553 isoform X1 [Nematostella vectensis]|uniref:uncharacterized protein LOC5521553 isoform X1 n=1 Tax=Nematostella vectensis TaxID=45351 RepID=UPI0013902A91|nr:uncharacterized protein LOC5521553 isoform X1 [Nematostella vectensis]
MADFTSELASFFQRQKLVLSLDFYMDQLWQQFSNGEPLNKSMLAFVRDVFVKARDKLTEDAHKKLLVTRFFCGIAEAKKVLNNGEVSYIPLPTACLRTLKHVCELYPYSITEKKQMFWKLLEEISLTAFRAGDRELATSRFEQCCEEVEEESEDIKVLLETVNPEELSRILKKHPYDKFLNYCYLFLKPIWEQYDRPLLEKYIIGEASLGDEDHVSPSLIELFDEYMDPKKEIPSLSRKRQTPSKRLFGHSNDNNASLFTKTTKTINALKESSKALGDLIKNRRSSEEIDDTDERNDELEEKDPLSPSSGAKDDSSKRKQEIQQHKFGDHPYITNPQPSTSGISSNNVQVKRKWNSVQEDAEEVEWTDDEDDLPQPIKLPDFSEKIYTYQGRHTWTESELKWLEEGVELFGKGHWSKILRRFPFPKYRTSVHLKDKWRNLNG